LGSSPSKTAAANSCAKKLKIFVDTFTDLCYTQIMDISVAYGLLFGAVATSGSSTTKAVERLAQQIKAQNAQTSSSGRFDRYRFVDEPPQRVLTPEEAFDLEKACKRDKARYIAEKAEKARLKAERIRLAMPATPTKQDREKLTNALRIAEKLRVLAERVKARAEDTGPEPEWATRAKAEMARLRG